MTLHLNVPSDLLYGRCEKLLYNTCEKSRCVQMHSINKTVGEQYMHDVLLLARSNGHFTIP